MTTTLDRSGDFATYSCPTEIVRQTERLLCLKEEYLRSPFRRHSRPYHVDSFHQKEIWGCSGRCFSVLLGLAAWSTKCEKWRVRQDNTG